MKKTAGIEGSLCECEAVSNCVFIFHLSSFFALLFALSGETVMWLGCWLVGFVWKSREISAAIIFFIALL